VARYAKGLDLYKAQLAQLAATKADLKKAHRMVCEASERDLEAILSGTLTRQQTRGAFARGQSPALRTATGRRRQLTDRQRKSRGIKGSVPVNPVNVQTGKLKKGVRLNKGTKGLQSYSLAIEGVDYAPWILADGGTSKMVSRQVRAELKKAFGPRNKALVDHLRAPARK